MASLEQPESPRKHKHKSEKPDHGNEDPSTKTPEPSRKRKHKTHRSDKEKNKESATDPAEPPRKRAHRSKSSDKEKRKPTETAALPSVTKATPIAETCSFIEFKPPVIINLSFLQNFHLNGHLNGNKSKITTTVNKDDGDMEVLDPVTPHLIKVHTPTSNNTQQRCKTSQYTFVPHTTKF